MNNPLSKRNREVGHFCPEKNGPILAEIWSSNGNVFSNYRSVVKNDLSFKNVPPVMVKIKWKQKHHDYFVNNSVL